MLWRSFRASTWPAGNRSLTDKIVPGVATLWIGAGAIRYGLPRASCALDSGAQISGTGGIPSSPNRACSRMPAAIPSAIRCRLLGICHSHVFPRVRQVGTLTEHATNIWIPSQP